MINLEMDIDWEESFDFEEVANLVADTVLDKEECPYECEIELTITDSEEVHKINKEYRNIDSTTDVLSFPNVEWDSPADYDCDGFNDDYIVNPDTEMIMLGQIVLNKDRIISQAEEFGHSVKRECAFLIAHSMLHLLGYDHMAEDEAKIMEKKQSEYLESIGIGR